VPLDLGTAFASVSPPAYENLMGAKDGNWKRVPQAQIDNTVAQHDYLRLVGDIVLARQSEDAFKTFREAGKMMGNRTLQEIGDIGERRHDAFIKDANRLAQHMFVERAQGIDGSERHMRSGDLEATI
jgi:hypothetical protein